MVVLDTPRLCSPALARDRTLSRSAHFHTQSLVRLVDRMVPTRDTHTHTPTHAHTRTHNKRSLFDQFGRALEATATQGNKSARCAVRTITRAMGGTPNVRSGYRSNRYEPKLGEEKNVPSGRGGYGLSTRRVNSV